MSELPLHCEIGPLQRVFAVVCVVAAAGLVAWQLARLLTTSGVFRWWMPLVVAAGMLFADLVSGMVHWSADTWGSETMPIIGKRFLEPFRIHHVNPHDFLRREFFDVNGDVAMICAALLAAVFWIPLDSGWGRAWAVFVVSFIIVALPTNQVHQWAHMRRPPAWVRWLQERRVILDRHEHALHHRAPYATHYCIATGWWNGLLAHVDFFRRAERAVTLLTGLTPRQDDEAFLAQVAKSGGQHGGAR